MSKSTSVSATPGGFERARDTWESIRRFLFFSVAEDAIAPARTIAASIEPGSVGIAFASRALSRIRVRRVKEYGVRDGGYVQPSELASLVSVSAGEFGAAGSGVVLGIPKAWAVFRTVDLPLVARENIASAVAFELDRFTPLSRDNAFFDFTILSEQENTMTVLVVAVRNETVRPYLEALAESGHPVRAVTVNVLSMSSLFEHRKMTGRACFLSADRDSYQGVVVDGRGIAAVFSGRFAEDAQPARAGLLAADITSVAGPAMTSAGPLKVYTHFDDAHEGLAGLVQRTTGLIVSPLAGELSGIIPREDREGLPKSGGSAALAAAGAVRMLLPRGKAMNLLQRGAGAGERAPLLPTVVLLLILAAMVLMSSYAPLRQERMKLEAVSSIVAAKKDESRNVEKLKAEAETLQAEIGTIENFRQERVASLTIMKELTEILPATAWLTRVRVNSDASVVIEGFAESATEILPLLEASKHFMKAEFTSPTYRDARMNSDRFVIQIRIERPEGNGGAQ